MFIKLGDLKLVKIQVMQDGNKIYEGMVEDAPDELKETNYKSASFQSDHIVLEV